ncbi:ornithine carbamoyltransferase [Deferrisoma camini]|uniref:ornithine carbamoyltransferase n=1 Tax=Deferrisoma camini TaxID=1035120 RepID=UPI00046D41E8|nr:ornithine carbamoyltransferase [Deferrisoma camini]
MPKHFLKLTDFGRDELLGILELAQDLKARQARGEPHRLLEGKTLAMLFEKSSTRTRVSFEVGMFQLGGHALFLSPRDTQIGRGEPVRDTARVLSRYVDAIMVRTYGQDVLEELARWSSVPVINGLTDLVHPCQVMADLLTVLERRESLEGLRVAWIGDGNNMAHSWIHAARVLGFGLRLACPEGYEPDGAILAAARDAGADVEVGRDPEWAARGAHVVTTDVWASMGQEEEQEARRRAFAGYTVDARIMAAADPSAVFLHCLPAHRGEEVTDEVLEGPRSAVWDEAENRLHVQKAILVHLVREEN